MLLGVGVALIACSFIPLGGLSRSAWTKADSRALSVVSEELHHPRVTPATKEEEAAYRKNLLKQFDNLKVKLEHAQNEPARWSRIMLWTGATLAGVGGLVHLLKQEP